MKKQKTVITGIIAIAILLMAIGYAAFSATELTITGSASAKANDENFKVYFTGVSTPTNGVTVNTSEGSDTAEVIITGLSKKDDTASAIIEIVNASNDVDAQSIVVQTDTVGVSSNFFKIDVVMCDNEGGTITDTSVASGSKTYVKVSAKLLQTPTADVSTTISATIVATPESNV